MKSYFDINQAEKARQGKSLRISPPHNVVLIFPKDLQHQLWPITLLDELVLAPIKTPQNVLDIGTGTGIWTIELGIHFYPIKTFEAHLTLIANRNPSATVIGSDLSPIQPD